jgi:RNA-directed DNA polymerase
VQYVGSVKGWSSPVYRKLALALQELDDAFKPRALMKLPGQQTVRIYTEGSSDPLHLLAAQEYFHGRGEFLDLVLETPEDSAAGSDVELLTKCKGLALSPQPEPCICIFDRDDVSLVAKAVGASGTREYGNGVAAIAIAPPPWREGPVCIELLYTDADFQRHDDAGRRLYLREEFNDRTGQHRTEPVHVARPAKTLVREEVYRYGSEQNVALSKIDFAKAIARSRGEFTGVDF